MLIIIFTLVANLPVHAAWFEASGQAVVENGNTDIARQNATQEAIKQALLFAGASVKSVQKMTDGLLQDDQLTIRANGEVNSIELIDERYHDGIVTVSIRADIFAQEKSCQGSEYKKVITTHFSPVMHKEQATLGEVFKLGESFSYRLQNHFDNHAQHSTLAHVIPAYHAENRLSTNDVINLARQGNSQYVLTGQISDLGHQKIEGPKWAFWDDATIERQFGYRAKLYDGYTGALVWQKDYAQSSRWPFEPNKSLDVNSDSLWQSSFGKTMQHVMENILTEVDEELACRTAYGRILQVNGETIVFDIGQQHGVKKGDQMTLFTVQQFYDPMGRLLSQYYLHPTPVRVTDVFPESASAISADGSLLGNIQTNDFVARR